MSAAVPGTDGLLRCPWALSTPEYVIYHDEEWGRRVVGEQSLFERMTLEAFQSGLSWITILRKRESFRRTFDRFDPATVATYDAERVAGLMQDASIVRNRSKIEATVNNAQRVLDLDGGFSDLLWSFAPDVPPRPPATLADVPAVTAESTAMARDLKRRGFRFVGPTTAYALMQATGMVEDHLVGCHARG